MPRAVPRGASGQQLDSSRRAIRGGGRAAQLAERWPPLESLLVALIHRVAHGGSHTGGVPRISRDWVAGGMLLSVGAFLLAVRFVPNLAVLIPLLIGLALLGVFLLIRAPALLTAGSVITGLGVGILTATQGSSDIGGAGALVSLGAGFLLVTLLGVIFQVPSVRSWPLVPGLALIAIGAVIYAAGLGQEVLDVSTAWWPVLLVLMGAYLLLAARLRLPLNAPDDRPASAPSRERLEETTAGVRRHHELNSAAVNGPADETRITD